MAVVFGAAESVGTRREAGLAGTRRRRGSNVGWWVWALLIGYASVLAVAAVLAVLGRTLMRPAAEQLHSDLAKERGDLAKTAVPLLPDGADSMIGGQVAA